MLQRSQFWLHVGTVSSWLAFHFVIIIIQNGLLQRILPLCLTIKLNCLCSEPCPPADGRKEEINTYPAWGLPFSEIFARLMAFLLCFLTSPHFWSIKEPGIQTQIRWLFWGASVPSSWSAGSWFKSLPCLNPSSLGFIDPSCGEQSKTGLCNKRAHVNNALTNTGQHLYVKPWCQC